MDAQKTSIQDILSRHQPERHNLIPILHEVQRHLGYLTPEAMQAVAGYLRLTLSTAYGVATFYSAFRFKPGGRHSLKVCRGTACHIKGGRRVLHECEVRLGIQPGETTADREYTLETEACFGSCALAPVVVRDERIYGRMTPAKISDILRGRK